MKTKYTSLSLFLLAMVDFGILKTLLVSAISPCRSCCRTFFQVTWTKTIHKRSLRQLCDLIEQHTDMDDKCWSFNNYGNYCGYGQKEGSLPVDPIDNCCIQHDNCYTDLNCWFNFPKLFSFRYTCENDQCTCTDPTSFWRVCRRDICECDLELARCLGRNQHLYNSTYINYRFRNTDNY